MKQRNKGWLLKVALHALFVILLHDICQMHNVIADKNAKTDDDKNNAVLNPFHL